MDKRGRMLGTIDVATSSGLEIGPLHLPLVHRSEGRVLYVDYADADTLRANFRHQGDPADIVDVDIVWGSRPLLELLDHPVDYILASHVIEHVPDLIGWLMELHAILRPGGILGLAIPDRSRTFDVRRQVSSPGEMVEAWLLGYRRPSIRQVFEAAALSKDRDDEEDWILGTSKSGLPDEVRSRLQNALDLSKSLLTEPRYIDVHAWVFTIESFLDTAEALHLMGCFPFAIEAFYPTEPGQIEFQVRLRAIGKEDTAVEDSIKAARESLREVLPIGHVPDLQTPEPEGVTNAFRHLIKTILGPRGLALVRNCKRRFAPEQV